MVMVEKVMKALRISDAIGAVASRMRVIFMMCPQLSSRPEREARRAGTQGRTCALVVSLSNYEAATGASHPPFDRLWAGSASVPLDPRRFSGAKLRNDSLRAPVELRQRELPMTQRL